MKDIRFPTLGRNTKFADGSQVLNDLMTDAAISESERTAITQRAVTLVKRIRTEAKPSLMEHFLAEYGLSTREGVALMCLAEAMLRVPDTFTIDALIEDKIAPSEWNKHIGTATSSLVNASTWALMITGKVLDEGKPGVVGTLRGAVKRLGEPLIRAAVKRAMQEMGRQFVLGETIEDALKEGRAREAEGFTFSFDMLGEAARTKEDAERYAADYAHAIETIGRAAQHDKIVQNPGISIKLSALHPRFEAPQEARVLRELVPVVQKLARQARDANIALHIDAEEQDRLVLSFKVIEAVLADEYLVGWDGFGVVVQAYGKRASPALDTLYDMAQRFDRKINIRLVKGAYWDTEMKLAQVAGLPDFTLFTTKAATDVSYICLAKKLFSLGDRLFPQFATHNAHTVAAVQELADGRAFEFQRLHGMGERLHDIVLKDSGGHCRIYAPVGAHRDLLAYLVRRLLENGANSSFVNQIVDEDVPPEEVAADPFLALETAEPPTGLVKPRDIFGKARKNARGFDMFDDEELAEMRVSPNNDPWRAAPITVSPATGHLTTVTSPADEETIGEVQEADVATATQAIADAAVWSEATTTRADVLRKAADLYEANYQNFFDLLTQEAGKTLLDCIGELREAVDFLRYYADQGAGIDKAPRGIITAISPWNFPLAIFTGQISAALMAGNAVLAKPAEATPLIAAHAVALLHKAGVPTTALQLLPGDGTTVGAALTSDPRVNGIVFTGSTETARKIAQTAADHLTPGTPLVAETGGLNAMIVDSTALPEQAVRDIIASAFQSAGQRCSALRCLYLQEDSAETILKMIKGAMDELTVGNPADLKTDIGPVIDPAAKMAIEANISSGKFEILHQVPVPQTGAFVTPTLLKTQGIQELDREIFGPVLHVATFKADEISKVVQDVNAKGYGLTFGLHTRIDTRVQEVTDALHIGNIYVNRNQIGAVVGSQPFGGEGLSGTGPKAGGPLYLPRFYAPKPPNAAPENVTSKANALNVQTDLIAVSERKGAEHLLPGPTGELNRLSMKSRPAVLCLGPGKDTSLAQAKAVSALGGAAVRVDGEICEDDWPTLSCFSAVLWWGDGTTACQIARHLAHREGPLVPLITAMPDAAYCLHERHLCIDTTASGGNAALLGG